MSSWVVHHNEEIFPNSTKFDPNRWGDPEVCKALEKYLFAFGKGSRQCVGMPYVLTSRTAMRIANCVGLHTANYTSHLAGCFANSMT